MRFRQTGGSLASTSASACSDHRFGSPVERRRHSIPSTETLLAVPPVAVPPVAVPPVFDQLPCGIFLHGFFIEWVLVDASRAPRILAASAEASTRSFSTWPL